MKQKTFRAPMQLKQDGEEGEFTAVFATLNVVDKDGDVTTPGAFDEQEVIIEPWNHSWSLPSGRGMILADDEKAWVEGNFFLDTEAGRENYQTVKNLGDLVEWSYTFNIEEAGEGDFEEQKVYFLRKLDVVGVSPVTRGAGIDTSTVDIKSREEDGEAEKLSKWRAVREEYLSHYKKCVDCGRSATEVDHIIPIIDGGTNDWSNLRAMCKSHHSQRTAGSGDIDLDKLTLWIPITKDILTDPAKLRDHIERELYRDSLDQKLNNLSVDLNSEV